MWHGDVRRRLSVAASFVWRCLNSVTMVPFPHPAHRTEHADLLHSALGQDFMPPWHVTLSVVSEPFSEFIGFPISRSLATFNVCLELRSLPSASITRLHRY